MRSYSLLAVACAFLVAGAASTSSEIVETTLNISDRLPTSIQTGFQQLGTFSCFLETPTGLTIQFRPENHGDPDKYELREFNLLAGCAVTVTITDASDDGLWRLYYTVDGVEKGAQQYRVTVNGTETNENIEREVELLPEEIINTTLGAVHTITIGSFLFIETESCHIITPKGEEYVISDEIYIPGLQFVRSSSVACGVQISVNTEDFVGNWTLFSRDHRNFDPIERRLSFIINVEVTVTASPEDVTVTEGNNLYLRLANPASDTNSCKIIAPEGNDDLDYEVNENKKNMCGFVVHNIKQSHSGLWAITYGTGIIYRAPIQVTVNAAWEITEENLEWAKDRPVDVKVGPENAVYCRVVDPRGRTVFEDFGRCHIVLERATADHEGVWKLSVGQPGRVLTDDHKIQVKLIEAESRLKVVTQVVKERPEVLLTCSLPGEHTLQSCKFREPSGRILIATQGVGEDRYVFHGTSVGLETDVNSTSCGLRITEPVAEDLGLWRCAMQTADDEVYYGFLSVLCPWAMSDPAVAAAVVSEPKLKATQPEFNSLEGEATTMSCSVQAEIRYCYFRARNGTVFNISPATNDNGLEYVGAGFDAGECGIRISGLVKRDSGEWSCHVGLTDHAEEQRASFLLRIAEIMTMNQYEETTGLVVEGAVHDQRALEYCRFVRIDGLGFTSENLPDRYTDRNNLNIGICAIYISEPTVLDHHPWTVVARIAGQDVEVYSTTANTLTMPDDNVRPEETPVVGGGQQRYLRHELAWVLIVLLSITITLLAVTLFSKRTRQWTKARASAIRNSFRREKAVMPPAYNADTAVVA